VIVEHILDIVCLLVGLKYYHPTAAELHVEQGLCAYQRLVQRPVINLLTYLHASAACW